MILLDPWMLLLALLIPVALWFRRQRGSPAVHFAPGEFLDVPRTWRVKLMRLPQWLGVLALLLVVVALARPVHRDPLPYETEGIDILLCLDTSSSMTSNDMDRHRTRLDVAKDAAARFISGRGSDRIGLICFARYPDVRCPLTLDHEALKALLSGVGAQISDNPEDATGIGTAVARAAQVLSGSDAESRVVILFTDGEENVATEQTPDEIAPLHAAQLCEELGVRVYTIVAGIGSPDQSGGWAALDTSQVETVAERTGGRFFEARDAGAVTGVYAAIDELERVVLDEPSYRIEERFIAFLAAAFVLLFTSGLLKATVLEVLP